MAGYTGLAIAYIKLEFRVRLASTWLTGVSAVRGEVNIEVVRRPREDVWPGTASQGVCRSSLGARVPSPHRLPPCARRPPNNPDAKFHYIRHDRWYLHPVMFFDSLLRVSVCLLYLAIQSWILLNYCMLLDSSRNLK